jgi:outer membrane lipoprotein-sorting protein
MNKAILLVFGLLAAGLPGFTRDAAALDAAEIIRRVQDNMTNDTEIARGEMVISDRFGERTKSFISYAAGTEEMLLEFTNPEERGQKILRLADEIYLYFPEAEEIIHLQGSALKESVMGSDFSYEDMTGEKDLLKLYEVKLLDTVDLDGRRHYLVELKGRKRGVAYPLQKLWVDAELLLPRRAEYYSLSGRFLKELVFSEFRTVDGRPVASRMLMTDKMKKNSSTEFVLLEMKINRRLPEGIFSLEELSW